MKITLRDASENDLDALVEMRVALQKHLETRDPEIWKFSRRGYEIAPLEVKARLRSKASFMGVAENENGLIVGMIMAEAAHDEYRNPERFGHIHWVYVKEDCRCRGLGCSLVKMALNFFSRQGIEQITIGYVVNNPEAHAFWDKLGFVARVTHSSADIDSLAEKLSYQAKSDEEQNSLDG
jgi:ribosomal protein S18 acetylase RimI-like enzyme